MRFATVPAAFAAAIAADPARPLLTWYDDATGERTELSGATLANWVAKTGNLLVDGCGLGRGDTALVDAPPHWQSAAVLLGCWSAGLRVTAPPDSAGALAAPGPPVDVDVVFAAADRAAGHPDAAAGADVYGLALAPFAAPMRETPPGVADFVTEVRAHGDHFTPPTLVDPTDLATTQSHEALTCAAAERAGAAGIEEGGRVLIDVDTTPDPLDWLLAPLMVGASTVLCTHLDPATLLSRVNTERVTATLPRRS